MKKIYTSLFLTGSLLAAQSQIIISEVDPNGSSSATTYKQDWFELKNLGSSTVSLVGWKMDDSSDSFSTAVALTGVTSIAAGQSVVFVEDTGSSSDTTLNATFETAWFGSSVPTGFTIGNYGGSGVGLSSSSDAVNIFDSSGNAVTGVTFGSTTVGHTLDNAAGLSGAISQLSAVGVNNAFLSFNGVETGSPGDITPAPEPTTLALAGLGLAAVFGFRRNRKA